MEASPAYIYIYIQRYWGQPIIVQVLRTCCVRSCAHKQCEGKVKHIYIYIYIYMYIQTYNKIEARPHTFKYIQPIGANPTVFICVCIFIYMYTHISICTHLINWAQPHMWSICCAFQIHEVHLRLAPSYRFFVIVLYGLQMLCDFMQPFVVFFNFQNLYNMFHRFSSFITLYNFL